MQEPTDDDVRADAERIRRAGGLEGLSQDELEGICSREGHPLAAQALALWKEREVYGIGGQA
jgi:hypothetical protein